MSQKVCGQELMLLPCKPGECSWLGNMVLVVGVHAPFSPHVIFQDNRVGTWQKNLLIKRENSLNVFNFSNQKTFEHKLELRPRMCWFLGLVARCSS